MKDASRLAQLALLGEAADCTEDVAIFVWDDDRTYVAANDAAAELIGRSREEILQMHVGDMSPNRATPQFEDVQRGPLHRGSSQILRDDGSVVDIEWVTCRTRVAGLPYMVSICWRKDEP
jgi:PAS domain S-box-containing protein